MCPYPLDNPGQNAPISCISCIGWIGSRFCFIGLTLMLQMFNLSLINQLAESTKDKVSMA